MTTSRWNRIAVPLAAIVLASCGGSDETPNQQNVSTYMQNLPTWEQYSPPVEPVPPEKIGDSVPSSETIKDVPVIDPVTKGVVGYRTELYQCTTTDFNMADTPEKLVMFSPDREILWPGSLIQGKSHRDGVGSLLPLTIRERAAIKVSIPSLANADNFRLVQTPDQAEVNQAIGSMILNATTANLVTPSTIQFLMEDYNSEESFALKASMSGKYMGFRASASAAVSRQANERTVMVYFYEKMFEVVVEPPQTPGMFFSDEFTGDKLNEQIALGKIGPDNPPIYLSNVVYGRMMAFTFTSTASTSEIQAALNAAYKGIFSASVSLSTEHKKVLEEGKISVTSLGGQSKASVALIASGNWRDYFTEVAPLTSAYPISYTFRNLRDGSIAKVSESTRYSIRECSLTDTAFTGFVLDSFETDIAAEPDATKRWSVPVQSTTGAEYPIDLAWGAPTTPQSIFYGYLYAKHTNAVGSNADSFTYDVGYLYAPSHFRGDKADFYKGELSFWFRPDDVVYSQTAITGTYCYWVIFPIWRNCISVPAGWMTAASALDDTYTVLTYDNITTFDQVVLRGGVEPFAVLTLTYNPKVVVIDRGWARHVFSLTNDSTSGNSQCDKNDQSPTYKKGCWLTEDDIASEEQIQYVLANLTDFRVRASYPVQRSLCLDDPAPADPAQCVERATQIGFGYVGGYFDEVKLNKRSPGL